VAQAKWLGPFLFSKGEFMKNQFEVDFFDNWPVNGRQFLSRTSLWKCTVNNIRCIDFDRVIVDLLFDIVGNGNDSSHVTSNQRNLVLCVSDFGFVVDERFSDRLDLIVLDFLDSEAATARFLEVITPIPAIDP
jgi:hypothetical protein